MNIFAVSPDPAECAECLDDLRLNKMITETAQLLSTTVRMRQPFNTDVRLMKIAYPSHPCTQWTRASWSNFAWLTTYLERLKNVWGGDHKSFRVYHASVQALYLADPEGDVLVSDHTPFPNCTPGLVSSGDVHLDYKRYLCIKWNSDKVPPTWSRGTRPDWYERGKPCLL